MVADLRYFNSLKLEVDSLISQLETQKTQFLNEIDRLSREYYYADHMNAILGMYTELDEDLKAQLQDKGIVISELKKLMEKLKGKSVDTKFKKSSVIRQPNTFKSHRPSVLGKPTTFSNSFTLPSNKNSILKNMNVFAPGMYKVHTESNQTITSHLPQDSRKTNKRVLFSTRVIPTTSVSRQQLKSNPIGDRVIHNNSQGKNQKVEDQRRNVKLSKNKTSVTAWNDSLNAKTLNVNSVCATCDTCVLNDKHDMCVLNSISKPIKKTVASESNQKPSNITKKLYERIRKACSWWYPKFTPSGYKWKPKSEKENVNLNTKIVLFIVDSGCSKHMTGNLKLLINFMEKFLGTVKFGNDQIAPILGYEYLVQGAVMIKRVYYVEGLNHNLFSVGQFCDADLEVAFRKSTCFIRDLKGNDLLTCSRGTDLYSITLHDTNYPNLICLMAKASSSQAWLWHRRLSHLNFDTINLLSKNDIVACPKRTSSSRRIVRTDKGSKILNQNLHAYFAAEGIHHQTSVARTPEQNGVVERRN
nr:integrase, catalytic region, zinc finger, CCHC-type, peptidase aspartic, catalytic [Tanacetum cinerariifolium]